MSASAATLTCGRAPPFVIRIAMLQTQSVHFTRSYTEEARLQAEVRQQIESSNSVIFSDALLYMKACTNDTPQGARRLQGKNSLKVGQSE